MEDRGYVLAVSGDSRKFYRLPDGEKLAALQAAGYLPRPLPEWELDTGDQIFGYSLWLFLSGLAVYLGYLKFRRKPAAALAGSSPAPVHPPYAGPPILLPLRLQPSRRKWIGMLVFAVVFVVGAAFMIPGQPVWGWAGVVLFGLGIPVSLIQLLPGQSYLEIDRDGFTMAGMFRKHRTAWADVAGFGVMSIHSNKMVGWNYSPGYQGQSVGRAFASVISGAQAALPDTYGMKAEALAELLNECKRRSGAMLAPTP